MGDFVVKAVEAYIQMEKDARVIDLMRKDVIKGVTRLIGGQWRVDTLAQFFVADRLEEALGQALEAERNGRG